MSTEGFIEVRKFYLLSTICEAVRLGAMGSVVASAIVQNVQTLDEIDAFLQIFWLRGKKPLPRQVKLGLARVFQSIPNDNYLNHTNKIINLGEVLALCHPTPKDEEQSHTWRKFVKEGMGREQKMATQ